MIRSWQAKKSTILAGEAHPADDMTEIGGKVTFRVGGAGRCAAFDHAHV
jgi:hypothetical protein